MTSESTGSRAPAIFRLGPPDAALTAYGPGAPHVAVVRLAEAIVHAPAWPARSDLVLAGRVAPDPLLVAVGAIGPAERDRLAGLTVFLERIAPLARFWTWRDVEDACAGLAEMLRVRLGPGLAQATVVGVPRGGAIVASMLAYLLDVPAARVRTPGASSGGGDGPWILVDDAILSGARLLETLRAMRPPAGSFVAVLTAPQPALDLVRERTEGIEAVLAVRSLRDVTDLAYGEELASWRERWRAVSPSDAAWMGLTEQPCFPWSEPDVTVRNPVTGAVEVGWRVGPPSASLAARGRRDRRVETGSDDRLQWTSYGRGRLRSAAGVVDVCLGGQRMLVDVRRDRHVELDDVTAIVWDTVLDTDAEPVEAAARALARSYDVRDGRAREDVEDVVAQMLEASLLTSTERA